MTFGTSDEAKQLVERLGSLQENINRLRNEIEALAPAIIEADSSPETAAYIREFSNAGRKLNSYVNAILGTVRTRALEGGNYSFLAKQLVELRDTNFRYQETFDSLWKSTLPIHIKAILQSVDKTEAELWHGRWGASGQRAMKAVTEAADGGSRWALVPDQEQALLTLRYAGLSLNDVSRLLAVSPPLILNRQADLEVDIVIRLLREWLVGQDEQAIAQVPDDRIAIDAVDLRTILRRTTSPQPVQRPIRYMRLLNVQIDGIKEQWLLRVILNDEEMNERLDAPELTSKSTPDKIVVYRMGQDEFRFIPYDAELHLTLAQIEQNGSGSYREMVPLN